MEISGSLGDLGVLLPLALGMIMINHLDARGVFYSIGLFYCCAGLYFRIPVAVQPMKAIASYAIAMELGADQVLAAGLCMGIILLGIGVTNLIGVISRLTPFPVIRGVQLSTGLLLMGGGVRLAMGTSGFQEQHGAAEPFFQFQDVIGLPLQYLLAGLGFLLVLVLLNNRRFPASSSLLLFGLVLGLLLGDGMHRLTVGLFPPKLLPQGLPSLTSLVTAFLLLVLPQLPMTIGNAVLANADLARRYFNGKAYRSTDKALCISMGLANIGGFFLGGMPMCHGAGGLAAHYRFGARTGGSNLIVGGLFLLLALLFGDSVVVIAQLVPLAMLGVLLFYAGSELCLSILDLQQRNDLFICLVITGITLTTSLAWGFAAGLCVYHLLRMFRVEF